MNLVLIGYRGTGKSSVATLLAERLGRRIVSTDTEIIARANLSIPDIVKEFGWDHFRDLESAVCRELTGQDGLVIDTGGGAILRQENVEALKANGMLFWLTADVPTIQSRIGGDTQRPSLTESKSFTEEIEDVLQQRRPRYEAAAHHVISTDGRSITQVAEAVLARFQPA
jgi:shikimate kinase